MFSYWTQPEHGAEVARFLNDDLAATVKKNPKKFIGLGTLPMQAPALAVKVSANENVRARGGKYEL